MMKKILQFALLASLMTAGNSLMAQVTVPATLDIPDAATLASKWTIIDNNAATSANTWKYGSNDAQYSEDHYSDADDWLISSGVQLKAGSSYTIKYYIKKNSSFSSDYTRYAITIGTDTTVAAQSTVLAQDENFKSTLYSAQEATFVPQATGVYYLGVHCYNVKYKGGTGFQKFEITENVVRPLAVSNLTLANVDGKPHVSFSAPTANTAGVAIDTTALVYRIVRNPGAVEVASALKGNTYVDNATLPLAKYTYTVYPVLNDIVGEAATSNGVIFGEALSLPYDTKMKTADEMAVWTIVDANADGKTWSYNAKNANIEYTSFNKADDWAFTPPFSTVAGTHRLKLSTKGYNYRYSDAFDVVLVTSTAVTSTAGGSAPRRISQVAGQTVIKSYADNVLERAMYDTDSVDFMIPASGTYYIGLHDVSTSPWGLYVNGLRLELIEATPPTALHQVSGDVPARYDRAAQQLLVSAGARVMVYNLNGALVTAAGTSGEAVSLCELPQGVYVAVVESSQGQQRIKFVK